MSISQRDFNLKNTPGIADMAFTLRDTNIY
jgi:hypothetical protein